ncbi:MAG: MFS transporter [Bryobacterales bacterium]|nr:MFS transporter [Bryobacterales bacterium]
MKKTFYGWWITAAVFCTFGLAVGFPYYNIPFFYDYFENNFGWSRRDITFGFPLAALLTLWVGPVLVPRFSPRKLILVGTGLTFLAFLGFGTMGGALWVYYLLWFVYTVGYILSGPIPHQLIVSHWFRRNRGKAMGIVYVGVGLIGSLGSFLVKPLTESTNFHMALIIMGAMMFLAWPLAILVLKDRPSQMGLFPDGAGEAPAEQKIQPLSYRYLLGQFSFWLLLIGSFCSIGSIGAVNFHMKFVFIDQGFSDQALLNATWRTASVIILWSSIGGRLLVGTLSDALPMKWVMTTTYFLTAATIPILLTVAPPETPWLFAILFGFGMGADYMLIPLMAAEQFGVNSLARCMAIILPVNTIGQTWFPYFVSVLRETFGNYTVAMGTVFALAMLGALAIGIMPKRKAMDEALRIPEPGRTTARG